MANPPTKLSARLLMRPEELPATARPPSVPPPAAISTLSLRMPQELHEIIRIKAFDQRRTIQSIIVEAIQAWVDQNDGA